MRILLISDEFACPENTGYRARIANILRALHAMGAVEWIVVTPGDHTGMSGPPDVDVVPKVIVAHQRRKSLAELRWAVSRLPWRIDAVDLRRLRHDLDVRLANTEPFDLVVFTQIDTATYTRPLLRRIVAPNGRVAIDFNDIESNKLLHRMRAKPFQPNMSERIRHRLIPFDRRKWQRLERECVECDLTLVCSDLDRERLGGRAEVLPNAVPLSSSDYRRNPDSNMPQLLFVGSLTYQPNIDALQFAAAEVLPLIRAEIPDATLRIVGVGAGDRVWKLVNYPGVELVGAVASVEPYLATASVSFVPLRFGGGTRVKILEAFAHHVPVVSTPVGAEGLPVRSEEHLLLATDAPALAAACVRLLRDPAAGERLADAAFALVQSQYTVERVRSHLVELLEDTCRKPPQGARFGLG